MAYYCPRQMCSAPARHDQVRQEQIDFAFVSLGDFQSMVRIFGGQDMVALQSKKLAVAMRSACSSSTSKIVSLPEG